MIEVSHANYFNTDDINRDLWISNKSLTYNKKKNHSLVTWYVKTTPVMSTNHTKTILLIEDSEEDDHQSDEVTKWEDTNYLC